jgi:hypothetical protein
MRSPHNSMAHTLVLIKRKGQICFHPVQRGADGAGLLLMWEGKFGYEIRVNRCLRRFQDRDWV